jgi:hypothetical protein
MNRKYDRESLENGSYQELQRQAVERLLHDAGGGRRPTVVPMRRDYGGEIGRCLTSITRLPGAAVDSIRAAVIDRLQKLEPGHHYFPLNTLHITIKNVRTVHHPPHFTDADVGTCKRVFSEIVPRHPSFAFELRQVAVFPTSVSVIGYSDERLCDLVLDLDRGLRRAGIPDDKRYVSDSVFFGNVTICRFTRQPSEQWLQAVADLREAVRADVPVANINLVTCDSVCSERSCRLLASYRLSGAQL